MRFVRRLYLSGITPQELCWTWCIQQNSHSRRIVNNGGDINLQPSRKLKEENIRDNCKVT